MKLRTILMLAACVSPAWPGSAPAQVGASVIGQTMGYVAASHELAMCLSHGTMSEKEAHEADEPTRRVMARYWAAASASDNARIDSLYPMFAKASWVAGGSKVRVRSNGITDPYARAPGNSLVEVPVTFVRGMSGDKARGLWQVVNASGGRVGYYLVDFVRAPSWQLLSVELLAADAPAPEVHPFCEELGDIDAFRAEQAAVSESWIAKTVKNAEPVASCVEGPECSELWSRARHWVQETSRFPLIRDTDGLLLSPRSIYGDRALSFAVVLDAPTADHHRSLRFRTWCGNPINCVPSTAKARAGFAAALSPSTPADAASASR